MGVGCAQEGGAAGNSSPGGVPVPARVRFRVRTLVRRVCMAGAAGAVLWAWAAHGRAEAARRAREAAHDRCGASGCV